MPLLTLPIFLFLITLALAVSLAVRVVVVVILLQIAERFLRTGKGVLSVFYFMHCDTLLFGVVSHTEASVLRTRLQLRVPGVDNSVTLLLLSISLLFLFLLILSFSWFFLLLVLVCFALFITTACVVVTHYYLQI